jgi:hypothetical protein
MKKRFPNISENFRIQDDVMKPKESKVKLKEIRKKIKK